jgi:nitrate reductase alpha subunit
MAIMKCPQCSTKLEPVPMAPYLNSEQWDATKAGDWFRPAFVCEHGDDCPVKREGRSERYRYARDRDLEAHADAEARRFGWN